MVMAATLFPTTVVGSYPQPEWLIDRSLLAANTPPRVRMRQLWRVAPEFLEQAQDEATLMAIRDQERAGIDIVSDGEMRRESYFNRFATALDGIDLDHPGTVVSRTGTLLVADRQHRRIVLRLHEEVGRDPPQLAHPHAGRRAGAQQATINQPVGLRVRADERRRQQR